MARSNLVFLNNYLQLLYTHEFNKRHKIFDEVEVAAVQENLTGFETIYNPTTDRDDFTIPPVDTTKVYKRRNQAGEDSTEECYIPSTTDWSEGWNPSEHISDLNLEDMDIGTQTQKELDYCSTPLQLTGVIYDDAAWEALNKNKKVQSFGFFYDIINNACFKTFILQ
ncbi:hypothetical protein Hanom_Chr13g01187371 [Helianthus anomalus]